MIILTLNCGSSSLKYQLYDWTKRETLANGIVERIAIDGSVIKHSAKGKDKVVKESPCPSHKEAMELIIDELLDPELETLSSIDQITAVGHRVVHGGDKFKKSFLITKESMEIFRSLIPLGPLHLPANITGIESAQAVLPKVPHCAIMDTAWHQTMPETSYLYALPYSWYKDFGVRRYGFHGTSFLYTAKRAAVLLDKDPFKTNVIIAHIGNGSSINAVKNGCSLDTSMGLTPLEGLIMGTRSGDADPAIGFFMMKQLGVTADEMEATLNKKSGVLGITEKWVDRRDIEIAAEQGNERAQLAIEMEAYRIKKYIGAYAAALGRVDAIVFTAGVGEMGPVVREFATSGLENFGIKVDKERNWTSMTRNAETEISAPDSDVKVYVIPTDEELVMTEDTYALTQGTYDIHTNFTYSFQSKEYINKERSWGLKKDLGKRPGLERIVALPKNLQ